MFVVPSSHPDSRSDLSLAAAATSGLQTQQLHVEGQRGVGRDDPWVTFAAVRKVRGAGEFGPLTHAHLGRETECHHYHDNTVSSSA